MPDRPPLTQRQIYRRRRIVVFGGALVALAGLFYLPLTLLAPLQSVDATVTPPAAIAVEQPVISFPEYGASGVGAIGYPGVLASAGATTPLPIASISKIVTALVVLDSFPLALGEAGPTITFDDLDEGFYAAQVADGGVVQPVYAGQAMSQRDVMNVMLLRSANNYAQSLVRWAFGSEEVFVSTATAWLAERGLASTTIVEPTGVSPANASTVPDLIELARMAIENPVVAEIVATQSVEIPELGTLDNRNELLGIDGIDGIKTGTLDEAGSCLLFAQDVTIGSGTVTVVGVVLGGPDHATINEAIRALLAQVDAGFREVPLTTQGEVFAHYSTDWGDAATAVAEANASILIWAATPVTVDIRVDPVALAPSGTPVGEVVFTAGERTVEVPLELSATIDDPGPWWRLTNPALLF